MLDLTFPLHAPHGDGLNTKGWLQEAVLRCLLNNLDPDVAEDPENLIVYGGRGKAARNLESLHAIVATLQRLENDETLLVQSGKPVGVFRTHEMAPRVLIANSLLVPRWATLEHFWELEAKGLMMYGQMTAGSWIYIGSQGILQGTYQTFAAIADKLFGGTLAGTVTLTGGLGGMGGAQPLAITLNGGVAICVEVDPHRIDRRVETGYLDVRAETLDEAVALAERARAERKPLSIGLLGNAAEVFPLLLERGAAVDIVTDQTSAHDPLYGYVPAGYTLEEAATLRGEDPDTYIKAARESMATQCEAMVGFQRAGAEVFDYGNNLRGEAQIAGLQRRLRLPGLRPRLHPRPVRRGVGAFPMGGTEWQPGRHRRDRPCPGRIVPGERGAATAGCAWRRRRSNFKGCPPASAGCHMASVIGRAWPSTSWSPRERSRRPS